MVTEQVVITGVGLLTPLGRGTEVSLAALNDGAVSIDRDTADHGPEWMRWAGRVHEVELPADLPRGLRSQVRFLNRGARLALAAAHDAVLQAGPAARGQPDRRALFLATGDLTKADCEALHPATSSAAEGLVVDHEKLNRETVARVNPFFLLETLANNPYSVLGAAFEITGAGTTLASHSPAGAQALDLAYRSISSGRCDLALVVGCGSWLDVVPRFEMAGLGLLSSCRDGSRSYRPFDRRRDGFIVGEGAAAMVLESADSAHRSGTTILGTVDGTSCCLEATTNLAVGERITSRCMRLALEEAGLTVGDLGFICPHGSGTRKGDRSEAGSLCELLEGEAAVPVCALKPYTGHMGAASDIAEVILGLLATRHGFVPGTPNFEVADTAGGTLDICASRQPCRHPRFLSVAYGLGGQSASTVVSAACRDQLDG